MKNPLASLKPRLSELKGRTLLLVIVMAVILVAGIIFIFGDSNNGAGGSSTSSSTVRAPRIQQPTPGTSGKVKDQAYVELQRQANMQKAENAIQSGRSAVATVTNDQYVNELSIPEPGLAGGGIASLNKGASADRVAAQQKQQQESMQRYQQIHQEQIQKEQQREQQRKQEAQTKQEMAYQDAFESLMQNQAKGLLSQWNAPTQKYVNVTPEVSEDIRSPSRGSGSSPPLYKAGDIIFGVMETSVNSDEPGPVLAKVVSGTLAGSKLIGSFRRVDDQVFIEFSLLNAPNSVKSVPVKAVAIDPETARTALATDVDYHRLLRYGTLFASAFLQGVGEAVLAGIQPDFTVDGSTFSVSNVETGTKDQVLVGLGEVGTKLGDKLDPLFNTPPTVTVDSGTAVGLLFLQDFVLNPGENSTMSMPVAASQPIQVVHENSQPTSGLAGVNVSNLVPANATPVNPTSSTTKVTSQ